MIEQLSRAIGVARRSLDNPGTSFWQSAMDLLGGSLISKSGVAVTQDSSIRLSAYWRGIRILSETLASVPLCLYERQAPRGRRKAIEHYLFPLLHDQPNPDMTSLFARECMQAQVVMVGNGYAAIRRDRGGRVAEIWPLMSDQVNVRRDRDGELVYSITLKDGRREVWQRDEMLHIPGLSFDGVLGKSNLAAARDVIGTGLAVQDYGATFFKQGGRPPGVVETQLAKILDDNRKNLEESWLSGRGDNWHKVAFLPKGMKYTQVGIPPNDAQWLESRKFTVTEIARMLGVPPHLLYDLERATFANIEMQSLEFVIYSMRPWFVRWEQELNRKLLTEDERKRFYFEFNADALMRGDAAARGAFYSLSRQWGFMSANDIRELENQPGIGPAGDVYLTPINMANAEELVDGGGQPTLLARQVLEIMGGRALPVRQLPPAPMPAPAALPAARAARGLRLRRRLRKAHLGLIEDRARAIVKHEIAAIEKELKGLGGRDARNRRDLGSLRKSIEDFYDTHAAWAGKKMHPIVEAYATAIYGSMVDELGADAEDDPPAELDRFVSEYAKRFGIREASEGRQQLLALTRADDGTDLEEDAAADAIRGRLAEWDEKRPGKIAAIEATREMGAVAKVLYLAAGVTVLRWVSNPGACPYCASMDGRTAGVQQNFVGAGEGVAGGEGGDGPLTPSDNIGHPPLHDNCSCDIVAD